jgi:hypothetical protein
MPSAIARNASNGAGSGVVQGGLATGLAFSATSIVISGSVVQIGNALYWKERNRKCKRGEAYVPGDAPAPSPAASSAA